MATQATEPAPLDTHVVPFVGTGAYNVKLYLLTACAHLALQAADPRVPPSPVGQQPAVPEAAVVAGAAAVAASPRSTSGASTSSAPEASELVVA